MLDGYLHLCRRCKRKGTPHEEKHTDCQRRRCPKCGMLLWAKALPRRFRLHDTRHTTATLLLAAGVELYAVARILRHSDPMITFETYAHLVPATCTRKSIGSAWWRCHPQRATADPAS